ncbi:endothelin-converting protein [Polaribacter pacificus]|uniref:Endothelin-converting protein n=1 Tax=Polaribacter pacificus TaxID=1775173 RepID=A0A917MCE1_9FLAO|nr:M13 family metallopeptidase [Polaribacter pacificus]GGG93091.1 endothelin-converting protein [Polaribacter pacificus]
MKKSIKKIVLFSTVSAMAMFVSCKDEPAAKTPGIEVANMDTSTSPKEDFFRYVNGQWLDKTEIPADKTRWGSFNELRQKTNDDVLSILNEAIEQGEFPKIKDAQGNEIDSDQEKAVNYYATIMDTVARNKQGIAPLQPYLAKINELKNLKDLQELLVNFAPIGGAGFFNVRISNDLKNSSEYTTYVGPAGLGLSRDYYVDQDEDTKNKRRLYVAHIAKMFKAFGDDEKTAAQNAQKVFDLEYSLAEPQMTKEERRDTRKRYNPASISELTKMTPAINWSKYLDELGLSTVDRVIVSDLNYMKAMNAVLKNSNINDIKLYLRWNIINRASSRLTTDLERMSWEFYSKEMSGAKQQLPQDERALNSLNGAVGEALGKLYVEKMFPPEAKEKAKEMIANVMLGFEKRINSLEWMSDETKKKALEKLHKLNVKIAYPDKWKDYSALEIKHTKEGGTYFDNTMALSKWRFNENINKLGKPVDRSEWGMNPQTVNAYFNPVNNEIVFPAAILQAPFYNYKADEAVNYGGMGAVIGHEISHSFDDSGSRFDGDGNLRNWWTPEDLEQFTILGKQLSAQFSKVVAIDDVRLNGDFTLGENIGDLGGLKASFEGLKIFYEKNGKPGKIDGFTPEQRFFMSWATVWRTKTRDAALKNLIKTDSHSPGQYRAYMPLQNIDEFYEAFDISENDKMYLSPKDRVRIW